MTTSVRFSAWAGWTLLCCLALTLGHPSRAQERQKRVLALYVTSPGAAGAASFETVYQKRFGEALGGRLDFHSEFIDVARFSMPGYQAELGAFLRYKYKQLPPDVVIATTEGAHQFLEQFQPDLFPGVPIVLVDRTTSSSRSRPGMTGVTADLDLAGTLDLALTLQPATTRVFVVGGVSAFDRFYERLARQQLQRFSGRVTLTYLFDRPMAELRQTLARLPQDSVIYFLTLAEDGAGARFRSMDALDQLATTANVPIYGWNGVAMNHGIVAGRLYSNEVVAERTAELALRILRGEKAESIPVLPVDPNVTQLDWRQFERWGLDEARVPAGAAILFRTPSLWDQYKVYIAGALALMAVQTALIVGLLLQRVRRRRVEARLQASSTQISDLFGRLIAAQETERTRIARDLHDDISQRVAALSIKLSALKRRLRGSSDEDVMRELTSMQENTTDLAEGIRHVSHDLHPSVLQHAGLETALSVYCEEFGRLQAIAVTYRAETGTDTIEPETALCLYRITQEALRNVAKHARAHHVAVTLARTADGVQLSIADDGRGFALADSRGKGGGLGLVSMDERVRLLKGSVHIQTQSGGGTWVRVDIPLPHEPPPPGDGSSAVSALVNETR